LLLDAQESNQLFYSSVQSRDSHARMTAIPQIFYRDDRVSPRTASQFKPTSNSFTGVGERKCETNPQIFYRGSDEQFKAVKANFFPTLLQEHLARQTRRRGRKSSNFQLFCRDFNRAYIPAPTTTNLRQLKKITQEQETT